ncbi:hypothetical protein CASFOL_016500 [Castilleja foliolosa]|uniref:HAT C-terminal dimerisation domain-containing protein n=1 Tax=Castilleja foliolosa TaxID=1961234 RepID=A0ABD3D8D3_9LAMI
MGRTGMGTYGPNPTKELDNYFTTPFEYGTLDESGESVEFDILKWWGARHQLYPTVSLIAKEILAIPVSTVSVEQAFSEGGYMLDERRSSLRPHNLEAQMLLHDWANAEDRSQKNVRSSSEESETFYDTTSSTET